MENIWVGEGREGGAGEGEGRESATGKLEKTKRKWRRGRVPEKRERGR